MDLENKNAYRIPLPGGDVLFYAPRHGVSALLNGAAAADLPAELRELLRQDGRIPEKRQGPVRPCFLGLIPTRGCNLSCAYCDFAGAAQLRRMSFAEVRAAVDGYLRVIQAQSDPELQLHFFGGEPFAAYKEVVFALNYARRRAVSLGIPTHFEVTTNGFYPEERAAWIADNFDTVVLSWDGFPEAQNRQRPAPGGKDSFPVVCRSAEIFSRGNCELMVRSCVSAENAADLPDWAAYLAERFFPAGVCLEPMILSPLAQSNGLNAAAAGDFVRGWAVAYRILKSYGIPLIASSGNIREKVTSLCPLGKDALIVTPDGSVSGCWQLHSLRPAESAAPDYGSLTETGIALDMDLVNCARERHEAHRQRCAGCFAFPHCAGGCALNAVQSADFCAQTRALVLWQLLERLGASELADRVIARDENILRLGNTAGSFPEWAEEGVAHPLPERGRHPFPPALQRTAVLSDTGRLSEGFQMIRVDYASMSACVMDSDDALLQQLRCSGLPEADAAEVYAALGGKELP